MREYLENNISGFDLENFEPEPLEVKPFGEIAGRYPILFLRIVFRYAEEYDVEKGPQDKGFIFDSRLGAINVWDWDKGMVYTTLYANWSTGEVHLEGRSFKGEPLWTPEEATKFWNRVFANVRSNTPTLLNAKEE